MLGYMLRLCYVTGGWILGYVRLANDIGYVRLHVMLVYVSLVYVRGYILGWMLD